MFKAPSLMKGSHYTVALLSQKDFLNTRRTRRSDSISLVLSHENSDTLTESDLANAETSSNYSAIYGTSIVNKTSHTHTTRIRSMGSVDVFEEAVLQLFTDLKPSKIPSPDRIHPRSLSSLVDTISGPFWVLFKPLRTKKML